MFENSWKTSPAMELEDSVLLKSTADFSLRVEAMNTKYLLVNGVRVSLGSEPKYSFCYVTDQPPQRTLQAGSIPVQKSLT